MTKDEMKDLAKRGMIIPPPPRENKLSQQINKTEKFGRITSPPPPPKKKNQ